MHPLTRIVSRPDRCERASRRLFIERFLLAIGIYPVGLTLLGSAAFAATPAQSGSGDLVSTDVEYLGDGGDIQAYLSHPKGNGPFPGIILVDRYLNLED